MKRDWVRYFAALCGLFFLLSGCGKKEPPRLPSKVMPLKVQGLSGTWQDGRVILEGTVQVPAEYDMDLEGVKGCLVFYTWYPLEDPPCEECPIDYTRTEKFKHEVVTKEQFYCEIPVKRKEGILFIEVRLFNHKDAVGPPSKRVKLVME